MFLSHYKQKHTHTDVHSASGALLAWRIWVADSSKAPGAGRGGLGQSQKNHWCQSGIRQLFFFLLLFLPLQLPLLFLNWHMHLLPLLLLIPFLLRWSSVLLMQVWLLGARHGRAVNSLNLKEGAGAPTDCSGHCNIWMHMCVYNPCVSAVVPCGWHCSSPTEPRWLSSLRCCPQDL